MLKRPDTGIVIGVKDDMLLMVRDTQPHRPTVYAFPGGQIDKEEAPEDGARRKFQEETGYRAGELELLLEVDPSHKIDWTLYFFIARDLKRVREPDPGIGEQIELEWVTWDEFLTITKRDDFIEKDLSILLYRQSKEGLKKLKERIFADS